MTPAKWIYAAFLALLSLELCTAHRLLGTQGSGSVPRGDSLHSSAVGHHRGNGPEDESRDSGIGQGSGNGYVDIPGFGIVGGTGTGTGNGNGKGSGIGFGSGGGIVGYFIIPGLGGIGGGIGQGVGFGSGNGGVFPSPGHKTPATGKNGQSNEDGKNVEP